MIKENPIRSIKKDIETNIRKTTHILSDITRLNPHPAYKTKLTLGQRASDKLTKWAGSWIFIIAFMTFLLIWMAINGYWMIHHYMGDPFDPYPFILLNLVLSCIAAIQAPIILMSQNREAQRDRLRAQYDYAVNRKAEKEIQQVQKDLKEIKILIKRR